MFYNLAPEIDAMGDKTSFPGKQLLTILTRTIRLSAAILEPFHLEFPELLTSYL